MSTAWNFAGNNLLVAESGTSFATPRVAHLAGRLLQRYPQASMELIRALIVAHARVPDATRELFKEDKEGPRNLLRTVGYGLPNLEAALDSSQQRVTLMAEASIGENQHHFYEVPVPDDFLEAPARRLRRITVALAHTPAVRRTRLEYKCSEFDFRVVWSADVEKVVRIFRKTSKEEKEAIEGEETNFKPSRTDRSRGTVQAATWEVRQPSSTKWRRQRLFVVVTRRVPLWADGEAPEEDYALAIVLEDQERAQSRLYTQLQAKLQLRTRARLR